MVSVLLTAFQEPITVRAAALALLPQLPPAAELLIICPDAATTAVAHDLAAQDARVRHLPDPGAGKPTALNVGLQAARHPLVLLTDGDVRVTADAVAPLLAPFADPDVGAVTGQPVSASPRHTRLGYWSHLLLHGAHTERLRRDQAGDFLLCSGYLFACRRDLAAAVPVDALAEDAVISHRIAAQGKRIRYAPEAQVWVKYPSTYRDWLRQKVRSAGGYAQSYVRNSPFKMRSARLEATRGAALAWRFAQTWRERWWTLLLFAARLHLWLLVFWRVRVQQRPFTDLWQRVESTK